jgi:serine/threonine protein kinase
MHYLVLEYVQGVTLQELVARRGPLPVERAAHYVGQAAIGLDHAHSTAGLVHRDIKPANLLLDRNGIVKVLDLGLARLGQAAFLEVQSEDITRKFQDRSVLGTADYIAPEQAINCLAADTRADIYSLGATFYFLLTGQPPFPTGSATQKLLWHQMRQPVPVNELRADVPTEVTQLVAAMMAKDPAQRPQHPGEVVVALAPWLSREIVAPTPEEIPSLCPAAQGPASGTGSLASVNLSGRMSCSTSLSSISLVATAQGDPRTGASTASYDPPGQNPRTTKRHAALALWVALAAALLLGAIGGALACLSAFAR